VAKRTNRQRENASTAQKQEQLRCGLGLPTNTPAVAVDHLDAIPGSVNFSKGAKGGVDAHLAVAIYVVTEPDLLAHPNTTPDGATTSAGQLELVFQLGIENQALTLVRASSRPVAPAVPAPVLAEIKRRVDALLEPLAGTVLFDCAPIVTALGAYVPADPDFGRGGGVLALRFGSTGATISQLGPNQAWGIFLDADNAVGLLKRRIPAGLPAPVNVHWQANGPAPLIVADTSIDLSPLGIEIASLSAVIKAGPSFIAPSTLRLSATWSVDLTGIVWFLEPAVRKYVRGEIRRRLPNVTHNGPQSFFYDIALPPIPPFLDAQPQWAEITSSPAGMTIGGPVKPGPVGERGTLVLHVYKFARPTWWGHCRALAKGGDGIPPKHFEATSAGVRVQAGVNFTDAGAFCGAQLLPPNIWLSDQMSRSVDGVGFDLTVGAARKITNDVHLLVRTARGTRFMDLGRPIIRQAADGQGLDVQVNYIDDCLYLSGAVLKLALGEALTDDDLKPPPLEDPGWREWFHAERGVNGHLVTVDGLEPGEMINVRGRGLSIHVTANDDGVASVPGVVAISDDVHEVLVERPSRRPFDGTTTVRTVELTWLGEVGPADAAAVRDVDGIAHIQRFVDGTLITEIYRPDDEKTFHQVRNDVVELQPQPLPPRDPQAARLTEAAKVEDALFAYFLPGIDGGGAVALATLPSGRTVVVADDSPTPRVSGEYVGPPVGMHTDGHFAIARNADSIHLFGLRRARDVKPTDNL
jgi:hypothetical protein